MLRQVRAPFSPGPASRRRHFTSISPYCTECVEIVAEKCAKINVRSIVSEKRNEVDAATLMNTEKKANEVRKDWKGGGDPNPNNNRITDDVAGD